MRIGEAVAALGVEEPEDRDLCIVVFRDGRPRHAALRRVANKDVSEFGDVYIASGMFERDAIRASGGRTEENLREILWLPFDADLSDHLGWPKEWVHELPEAELAERIEAQRVDLEEVFAAVGLPIHRLDYTGYGLAAYIRIDPEIAQRVGELRALHRTLVGRINEAANGRLLDPQVSDAGTRIMRLVPCLNTKGGVPRESREIYRRDGAFGRIELAEWGQRAPVARAAVTRVIPDHGRGLSSEDAAALADAVRPYWTEGRRHMLALAVAGMCAKAGMPEQQCGEIVVSLAGDDPEEWDRQIAVRTSYERVRSGLEVRGFMSLRNELPESVAAYVDGLLGQLRMATSSRLLISPERQRRAQAETPVQDRYRFSPPPERAFYGWFGRYLELVEPSTEAADAFHLGSSLTVAAATIGRRVGVRYVSRIVYPNLYTLIVGPAGGSRKDTAIEFAIYVVDRFEFNSHGRSEALRAQPYKLATDIGSAEGLIKLLGDNGNTLLYLTEFSKLQRNAKRQSTNTIVPTLIQAWNNPRVLENAVKGNPLRAEYPSLSIIAAVQPGVLAAGMEDEDVTSGFMTRWMFFPGVGKAPRPLPPDLDEERLRDLYRELLDRVAEYGPNGDKPAELSLSAEAKEIWVEWYSRDNLRATRNEQEDTMRTRLGPLAQKVSLIYAVTDGAREIGAPHLEAAIALIEWMWSQVLPLMSDWGAGIDLQIEERITAVLRQHGTMKRWQLQARCSSRKWSSKDFAVVFDAMVKNGTVLLDPTGMSALVEA